uniref:Uncharacterized protein n=1 Tax=Cucumis melo TaxID=3656 RepID=A0A9I9DLF1_CUCME
MEERLTTGAFHALDCPHYGLGPSRLRRTTYEGGEATTRTKERQRAAESQGCISIYRGVWAETADRSRKKKFGNGRGRR